MQIQRISLAIATLSVAGAIAVSFAQDGKSGPVLPPPSLFDEPASEVRAVESQKSAPAPAVVKAKPASSQESAPAPAMQEPEEEQVAPSRFVWWKPWTWFSGRKKVAMEQPVATQKSDTSSKPTVADAPVAASKVTDSDRNSTGYAFDSPAKIIRSGMGTCLRTGMWDGKGAPECGSAVASNEDATHQANGGKAMQAQPEHAATQPTSVQSPPVADATRASQRDAVEVSALAPEKELARSPLHEDAKRPALSEDASAHDQRADKARHGGEKDAREMAGAKANASNTTADPKIAMDASVGGTASASGKGKKTTGKAGDSTQGDDGFVGFDKPLSMSAEALFGFKSSKLRWGGKQQLDKLATQLSPGEFGSVRVIGHTDRVGSPRNNKRLSLKRAKAVKEYLVLKGVDPDRIKVEGRGSAEPITDSRQCDGLTITARRACQAPDRRVEIVLSRSLAKRKHDSQVGG